MKNSKKLKFVLVMGLILACFLIFINVSKICANSQITGWDSGLTQRLAAGIYPDSANYFELCPDGSNGKCYGEIPTGKGFYTIANDELCKINSGNNFYLNEYNENVPCPFQFNWKEDNNDIVANLKIDTTDFTSPITPNIYLGLQENVPYGDLYLGVDKIADINKIDKAHLKFKASYCFGFATDQIDIDSHRRARFFYHVVWYNPIKEKSYGVSINLLDFRQHLNDGSNIGADNYLFYETNEANNCVIQLGGKAWGIIPQDYQPSFDSSENCSFKNQESDSWIEVSIPISDILNKLVDEGYLSEDDLDGTVTCLIIGGAELWGRLSASMEVKNHYITEDICNFNNTDSTGKCSADCGASSGCDGVNPNSCSSNSLKKCDSNCLEIYSCGDGVCNCGETSKNCLGDCPYNLSPAKGLGWDYNLTKRCVKTTGSPGDENYYEDTTQCENEKHWLTAVESEKTFGASCPGPQNRSFIINGEDSPVKLNWESHQSEYGENWSVNMRTDMVNNSHPCGDGHFTWFAFMNQDGSLPKPKELISSNIISYNDSTLPGGATRCIVSAQFFWDGKAHLIEIFVASTNWGDKDDHPGVIFFAEDILGGMDYLALEGSYFGHQLQLSEDPNWKWGDTEISIDWAPIIDFSINEGYFDAPTDWGNTSTQSVQVASEVYNKAIADLWHTDFRISSKSGYGKITSINTSNDNPKIGDTVEINYMVQNIGADDTITVACGPGYLPEEWIFSEYWNEKIYTLKNGEQKTDFCSFVVGQDLHQEQEDGKDVIGIVAGYHGQEKIWDEAKYEDITILPASSTNYLPIGYLDAANQSQISGWAYDENAGTDPIDVHIYIDGNFTGSSTANQSRFDLVSAGATPDPNHGFTFSTPTDLSVGEHTVNVYAINYPEGVNPELIGSPKGIVIEEEITDIEFIKIASDNWRFETKNSKQSFVPFGCNYYDPATIHLKPFTAFDVISEFDAIRTDRHFEQVENIGVNIVRILLSVRSFEPEFKQLNEESFDKVNQIIELAKKHNLRIIFDLVEFWEGGSQDVCSQGYPCVPWISWDYYTDETTLDGLEFLVSAFAKRYANEPTIFAWNLINEPSVRWTDSIMDPLWQDWVYAKYSNESALSSVWSDYPLSGENWNNIKVPADKNNLNSQRLFDYQLFREDIAYNWVKRLTDAIHKEDKNHFITLGNLQWVAPSIPTGLIDPAGTENFSKPSLYPAFNPEKLSSLLDYNSIHGYNWWDSKTDNYIDSLLRYSYTNKPVVLEEFSYSNSTIDKTLGSASGWLGWACYGADGFDWDHYFFNSDEQITDLGTAFKNNAPSIKNQTLVRLSDETIIPLNMKELLTDMNKQGEVYQELIQTYNNNNGPVGFISCYPDNTDSLGKCNINCGASTGCNGISPNACSVNSLKKCDSNCQEISSCGDGICNCGEDTSNCLKDCPEPPNPPIPPSPPTPPSFPEQTLLKTPDSFKIYIIINQKKKWIPTPEVFETLGYQWTEIIEIDKNELTLIPDYEDNLIRAINDFKVYLIVNGIKRHIPNPEIFLNYGFEWNEVKDISQETINQYSQCNLIKESKKEEIYYLCPERKIKRWLRSPEIFNSYNNKWEDIQVISKYEMDHYPTSILIKLNNSNDVYLIEGNKKRLIKTVEEFGREGLDWGKVMGVGEVEIILICLNNSIILFQSLKLTIVSILPCVG